MISSFFSKTQPIHYIILFGFLFIMFWLVDLHHFDGTPSLTHIMPGLLFIGVFVFSIFIADEMAKKGKMTDQTAFFMLFFVMMTLLFPKALLDAEIIFAQLFMILAIRRLTSAKEIKGVKQKVFDGTFLICIATLFCSWAVVFFVLVFFTINTYAPKSTKTWFAALSAVLCFAILVYAASLLINDAELVMQRYHFEVQLDRFSKLFSTGLSYKKILYAMAILAFAVIDFVKYRKKGGGKIILFRFMLLYFILGLLVDLLDFSTQTYIAFTLLPASLFLANSVQTIKKARLKEILLIAIMVIPFSVFVFGFFP